LLSWFAENLEGGSAYHVELSVVMRAIENADQRRWGNVWIKSYSSLVVMEFNNNYMIPSNLRNRWKNCKKFLYQMNFVVSRIYREGNRCADKLASMGM